MSHTSSIFSRTPIELPNRSGFDMSHENLGTQTCGTLVPVLVDELLPNDTISLGANFQVQLPPMATDFYGRVDYILEAFFVPSRLLWGGWKSFMTHPTANPVYPANTPAQGRSRFMPQICLSGLVSNSPDETDTYAGSLADYLGMKDTYSNTGYYEVNALPFLAYHRIWDDWYRDSRIQSPLFYSPDSSVDSVRLTGGADEPANPSYAPFVSGGVDAPFNYYGRAFDMSGGEIGSLITFSDGSYLNDLRQRNWSKDYFTSASPLPQAGNAATLEFDVNDGQGTFSIAALRSANSLQKWMERNNIMGYKYADQIYGQYGCYPSDAIMDKCLYLGRVSQNVYTRSVFQTVNSANNETSNPFTSTGSKFGSSQAIGEGSLVDNIRVKEHGFLMVLASLVPHSYYSTGMRRYLKRKVVGDIAFPLLSGMGEQAIMKSELDGSRGTFGNPDDTVFGYTDLYAEYKYHDDEVHGLLVDGQSLDSFALQRGFGRGDGYDLDLSTAFLQIPKEFMSQVYAVSSEVSGFDCWYDIFFPYKKISTLPEYSIPTLGDLRNVHTKKVSRGGTRL